MTANVADTHLPDGELIRLLDGELDVGETARLQAYLEECAACRQRLQTLRRRSARLTTLLAAADWQTPAALPLPVDELARRRAARHAPGTPWRRAAAVAALLLGAALLASPARAWITEWVGARWQQIIGNEPAAPPPAQPTAPAPQSLGARVHFTPVGDEFVLEFATRQPDGSVALERSTGAEATVEVLHGSAELLVLPDGVRVRNTPESSAEYRVVVPAGIRRVPLRVGEKTRVLTTTELSGGIRLPLR